MLNAQTKTQWYEAGKQRGLSIASWTDLPEEGKEYVTDCNGRTIVEDLDSASTVFFDWCSTAEDNGRQYTPFEFVAHEINEDPDAEEIWEAYNTGIYDGFTEEWNKRAPAYYEWDKSISI